MNKLTEIIKHFNIEMSFYLKLRPYIYNVLEPPLFFVGTIVERYCSLTYVILYQWHSNWVPQRFSRCAVGNAPRYLFYKQYNVMDHIIRISINDKIKYKFVRLSKFFENVYTEMRKKKGHTRLKEHSE